MGVALVAAALWTVTLRRVEVLARGEEAASPQVKPDSGVNVDAPQWSRVGVDVKGSCNGRAGGVVGDLTRRKVGARQVDGIILNGHGTSGKHSKDL